MPKVAIIGSGPAGYTSAIYAGRADLAPVLFTGMQAGGQLTTTTDVENYPGFPEGIMGPELMTRFEQQATRFGTEVKMGCSITTVERLESGSFKLTWDDLYQGTTDSAEFETVIIATGASARHLGIEGEAPFFDGTGSHHGVTACATCDGALPLYRNQPVCVVGGGDTACEEALFMTKFASKVYLIHRRDQLRASKIMAERAVAHEKIEPVWNAVVKEYCIDGDNRIEGVTLTSTQDDSESRLDVKGVFLAIGHVPNTKFLVGTGVDLDETGYVEVSDGCKTSVPGLFAAGDVRDTVYRQAITAAGMGCMAAIESERYLEARHS
ncbi:MAG: thioredoxin-disulfide reductase [Planctomycetota bacterium]|jgi:thioredoxin reductase (NADPH)|nr:thioredoxin-disulfide reductase [Planctomycetota bacterium]